MSFFTLPPDSRTLVSKLNAKLALIWKEDFGPLGNSPVLLLLSPGKTPLTVAKFLDTSVCGGSWCLDLSLSPFLVKFTHILESILLDNPHKAAALDWFPRLVSILSILGSILPPLLFWGVRDREAGHSAGSNAADSSVNHLQNSVSKHL